MYNLRTLQPIVDIDRLKDLLHGLAFSAPETSIRIHVKEVPSFPHFFQVLVFARHAILLAHMPTRTVVNLPDLSRVSAFEVDKPYDEFSAFTLYVVKTESQQLKQVNDGLFYA